MNECTTFLFEMTGNSAFKGYFCAQEAAQVAIQFFERSSESSAIHFLHFVQLTYAFYLGRTQEKHH